MSANTANSVDESSGSAAADFRIVVFSLPDDLHRLARALITLPHMDRATARLQTHVSSSANFQLLIQDLISRAAGAWITPSTLAFLEHTLVPRSEFRSHEEFRRYTEFQTLFSHRHTKPSHPPGVCPDTPGS